MEPAKPTPAQTLKAFFFMTLGSALVSVGVYFFKFPNHFNTGGVTGLAVILNAVVPAVSASTFASVITARTAAASVMSSSVMWQTFSSLFSDSSDSAKVN